MSDFVAGNRVVLLRTGSEYFPALETACDEAQNEIYLETYIFADDVAGQRIAQALMRAARRGVAVHVMIDGFGSKDLADQLPEELRSAGVRVLKYRPDISPWTLRRERLRRMHRKIVVIDARIAFVGGINVIDDMHTPNHIPPRFDYAVRVEGPLLADIHPAVTQLWRRVMWTQFHRGWPQRPAAAIEAGPCGAQRAVFVIRDNLRHRNDIEHAYLDGIAHARTEIVIACAYFFPGRSFRRALIEAAARGVRVVLLLQGRVEYALLHYASRALYGQLLDAGVQIYEYHKSFMHAKVAVIDQRWATVGSSNIDPFSLLLAREANIVVDDAAFSRELHGNLREHMESGSLVVAKSAWHQLPLPQRMLIWASYGLARLLMGMAGYGGKI
jgi:cardiolipin synthase